GGSKGGSHLPEFTTTTFPKTEVSGDLKVFAASSLTDVFTALGKAFEQKNPGVRVVSNFTFGDSAALAQQINDGAPADVFVAGDDDDPAKVTAPRTVGHALPIARPARSVIAQKA